MLGVPGEPCMECCHHVISSVCLCAVDLKSVSMEEQLVGRVEWALHELTVLLMSLSLSTPYY